MQCLSCGAHERARIFEAADYLFSIGETFEYFECKKCGSLQILRIPPDIGRHYPTDYYSMAEEGPTEMLNGLRHLARAARTNYYLNRQNILGWIIDKIGSDYFDEDWEWFRGRVSTASHILDVGCGNGQLLRKMHAQGFRNLTGVDPFVSQAYAGDGLRIIRGELTDLHERFDFVMLHHSLEHMSDPLTALCEVRRLLQPGGAVLVRVPIAGSYAERHYGINWIGLDPPRHLFIPSRTGLSELVRRAGFHLQRYWYDTTGWELLKSEAIARGLSVYDRDKKEFISSSHFSAWEVTEADIRATTLNQSENGDRACFILTAHQENSSRIIRY